MHPGSTPGGGTNYRGVGEWLIPVLLKSTVRQKRAVGSNPAIPTLNLDIGERIWPAPKLVLKTSRT